MKKYIKTAFVAAIVGVAGYNVYQSNHSVMNNLSEFALANVEALASDESVEQIKCNREIPVVCVLINNTPVMGERY